MCLKSPKGNDDQNFYGRYERKIKILLNKLKFFLDVLQNYNYITIFPVKNEVRNSGVKKERIA